MLESQKLALRASEIRTKLAELAGKEGELGEEERAEIAKFRTEYTDVETRYQASVTAEDVTETKLRPRNQQSQASYVSSGERWGSVATSKRPPRNDPLTARSWSSTRRSRLALTDSPWSFWHRPRNERPRMLIPSLGRVDGLIGCSVSQRPLGSASLSSRLNQGQSHTQSPKPEPAAPSVEELKRLLWLPGPLE